MVLYNLTLLFHYSHILDILFCSYGYCDCDLTKSSNCFNKKVETALSWKKTLSSFTVTPGNHGKKLNISCEAINIKVLPP